MSAAAEWHKERVASIGCVICLSCCHGYTPCELHHVAEGSGLRSDFAVVGLCPFHHRGPQGLHGMGTKRFCSAYSVPGRTEYGLLVMVNEFLARAA